MAIEMSYPRKRNQEGFMSVLSSATSEWFLMFMLFVDATFWYLLMKFARYCELEPPCLICSRLDLGFGKKKSGLYWSLLCTDHREEISSLVACSIHGKIANARSMCNDCLTSIAMQNHMTCSCCNGALTAKPNTERLLELDSIGFGASRPRPPLPRTTESSRFCHKDSLKRVREKFIGPVTDQPPWRSSASVDTMSNVAYTKLKLSSDSESEFAISEDDDDGNTEDHDIQHRSDALEGSALDQPNKNLDPLSSEVTVAVAVGALTETSESNVSLPHMPALSVLSEILSVCSVPSLPGVTTPKQHDDGKTSEHHHIKASLRADETLGISDRNALEPINTSTDSTKNEDVVKVSTSDLSQGARHRAHHKHDESRIDNNDSHPRPLPVPVPASSENKSNGSSDELTASDTEGEDIVEHLKRQVESDQNCLSALYKDLEEERNASAIAAEEAMAMITRLQEEKAALRMEALHYLRMMEEQAAYDMQALERANDLLAEREKEMQDLEYELESYRGNLPYEEDEDDNQETSVVDHQPAEDDNQETSVVDDKAAETTLGASSNSES